MFEVEANRTRTIWFLFKSRLLITAAKLIELVTKLGA
jgi:hypothetical protein